MTSHGFRVVARRDERNLQLVFADIEIRQARIQRLLACVGHQRGPHLATSGDFVTATDTRCALLNSNRARLPPRRFCP